MRKRKVYYFLLFILGLSIGVFFGLNKVMASTPGSLSTEPASVFYDEIWKATETVVSTPAGYKYFYPYGNPPAYPTALLPGTPPTNTQTSVAAGNAPNGVLTTGVAPFTQPIFPKMIVTKWKILGHIHFE